MDIKEFLNKICNEIKYKPIRKEISEEIQTHIEEIKQNNINNGMEEQIAEEKAIKEMGEAEEIGKQLNKIHRPKLDWKLLILIIILTTYGLIIAILKEKSTNNNYIANTIFHITIGLIIGIAIYFFDYRKIKKYSNLIYIIATIIMILPKIGILSCYINGIPYIKIFNITIMSSSIAVPLYIIAFIGIILDYNNKVKIISKENNKITINTEFIKIILITIISIILIIEINTLTNAIILAAIYTIIATVNILQTSKNKWKKIAIMYAAIIILPIILITLIYGESPLSFTTSAFRINRILASFNPETDPQGAGYTGMLQKQIIENAKIIGEADTEIISNGENIISSDTNYTFIYLLGKTGILASSILLLTIILTSIKLIKNAKNIKETYGKYIIIGLGSLYIIQSIASVLMNINLGIQSNINIPFVSYGGAYFIINVANIAIILSIYRRKDINLKEEKNEGKLKKLSNMLIKLDKKLNNVND